MRGVSPRDSPSRGIPNRVKYLDGLSKAWASRPRRRDARYSPEMARTDLRRKATPPTDRSFRDAPPGSADGSPAQRVIRDAPRAPVHTRRLRSHRRTMALG